MLTFQDAGDVSNWYYQLSAAQKERERERENDAAKSGPSKLKSPSMYLCIRLFVRYHFLKNSGLSLVRISLFSKPLLRPGWRQDSDVILRLLSDWLLLGARF